MTRQCILAAVVMMAVGGMAWGQGAAASQAATRGAGESPAVLLEKGIYQEETAGDLAGAAKTYRQIIADGTANRKYVAQAMYRLGVVCVRQKQTKEAIDLFTQLKAQYPEQKDLTEKATKALAEARSKLGEKEVAEIVDGAVTQISTMAEGDPRIAAALASLEGLDEGLVVKELVAELASKTNEVRRSAIYILWKGPMKDIHAAVPALEKLMEHEEAFTRGMATLPLGKHKIDYDKIVKMATEDKSHYARQCAVAALGDVGTPEAKAVVEKIAKEDKDEMVQAVAKQMLERWSGSGISPAIKGVIDEGTKTAEAWLKAVDDGSYGAAWNGMTAISGAGQTAEAWKAQVKEDRRPLGKMLERKVNTSFYKGTPGQEYVEVGYDTTFEKGKRLETLTLTPDGKKVEAYTVTGGSTTAPSQAEKMEAENLAASAWRLWGERKLPEAEAMFQKALEKDPTASNTWNGLGWSQLNQGKKENARASFEKAVALDGKNAAALNGLGWIAKAEGKTQDAKGWWKRAYEASPMATAAISGLAGAALENGDYEEAVGWYEKWLKAEGDSPDAKAGLAKAKTGLAAAKEAVPVTEAWLKLVDEGKYGESWTAAAGYFQKAITAEAWEKAVKAVRDPLGKVVSRKVKTTLYMTSVPGAPDEQYVVIQFETEYANKKNAIETVTPLKDKDGQWKVSGYYVK